MPPTYAGPGVGANFNDQLQPAAVDTTSVLKQLTKTVVIGSTVDPNNGDQNPYGLAYVKAKPYGKGVYTKGDLIVCNFNDKANVQGNGTTLEVLSSAPGSKPKTLLQNAKFKGCASVVLGPLDPVYAADSGAKNVTGVSTKGKIFQTLTNKGIVEPWSEAYAVGFGYPPGDGIFTSDASTGKIVRINLGAGSGPSYSAVISGLAVNHGQPGSILGPSGLQYNQRGDTLYVVDGVTNTVFTVSKAYEVLTGANALVVSADGKSFTGPAAKNAKLLYAGGPLNGPVSSALLPNGNIVIGNTLNKKGTNLMVEIALNGKVLATKNVDKGAAGAIFGMVAVGSSDSNTVIYFNDDNKNNVELLTR